MDRFSPEWIYPEPYFQVIKNIFLFDPSPVKRTAASRVIYIYFRKRSPIRKSGYPKSTPLEVTPTYINTTSEYVLSNVGYFSIHTNNSSFSKGHVYSSNFHSNLTSIPTVFREGFDINTPLSLNWKW